MESNLQNEGTGAVISAGLTDFSDAFASFLSIYNAVKGSIGPSTLQDFVENYASLVFCAFQYSSCLNTNFQNNDAGDMISELSAFASAFVKSNFVQSATYNPQQLYQAFLSNPAGAYNVLSSIQTKDLGESLRTNEYNYDTCVVHQLASNTASAFEVGGTLASTAFFLGHQMTAKTAAAIGAGSVWDATVNFNIVSSFGACINSEYNMPMATALFSSWTAAGELSALYAELNQLGSNMADPGQTNSAVDLANSGDFGDVYGEIQIESFFNNFYTYNYDNGETLCLNLINNNNCPTASTLSGLQAGAATYLANANSWMTALQQMSGDAAALASSADPNPTTFSFEFPLPKYQVPTIASGPGFLIKISPTNAKLSVRNETFEIQNEKWGSNIPNSLYLNDSSGNSYMIVSLPQNGTYSLVLPAAEVSISTFPKLSGQNTQLDVVFNSTVSDINFSVGASSNTISVALASTSISTSSTSTSSPQSSQTTSSSSSSSSTKSTSSALSMSNILLALAIIIVVTVLAIGVLKRRSSLGRGNGKIDAGNSSLKSKNIIGDLINIQIVT